MNITGIIKTLLDADSAINAVLAGRIFPAIVPGGTLLPTARVLKMATEPNETKDGSSEHDFVHVQISVFADGYKQAESTNERIRQVLDAFNGVVTTSDGLTHLIGRIVFQDSSDQYDDRPNLFHVSSDYICRVHRISSSVEYVPPGVVPFVTNVTAATASIVVPAHTLVEKIVILSSAATATKCGTSAGGDQVMKLKYGTANVPMVATVDFYATGGATLHFSGLAGNTRIVVYTQ